MVSCIFVTSLEDPHPHGLTPSGWRHLPGMTWGHLNRLQAEAAVSAGEAALKAFRSAGGWRCGFKCWNPFDVLNPSWIEYQWCLMMMDRIYIDVLMSLKDFPSFVWANWKRTQDLMKSLKIKLPFMFPESSLKAYAFWGWITDFSKTGTSFLFDFQVHVQILEEFITLSKKTWRQHLVSSSELLVHIPILTPKWWFQTDPKDKCHVILGKPHETSATWEVMLWAVPRVFGLWQRLNRFRWDPSGGNTKKC